MIHAKKVDSNHTEIVAAFRAIGVSVADTHALPGFVDLVVGAFGVSAIVEIKSAKGKLTPGQTEIVRDWKGAAFVVWTIDDAIKVRDELARLASWKK